MFDSAVAVEPRWGCDDRVPDDDLDGALDDWPPPDWPPTECAPGAPDEPVPGYGSCEPSGWLALDLDVVDVDSGQAAEGAGDAVHDDRGVGLGDADLPLHSAQGHLG